MPVYAYQCNECEVTIDIRHSMKETREDCTECGAKGSLVRVPSVFSVSDSTAGNVNTTAKQRVDTFIADAKVELEQHRKESRVDYEPT